MPRVRARHGHLRHGAGRLTGAPLPTPLVDATARRVTAPPLVQNRQFNGGGIGSQRNPYLWAGDQWRVMEKLDDQVLAMLNAGMSGVPFMTYDLTDYQYGQLCAEPDGKIGETPVVVRRSRTLTEKAEAAVSRRGVARRRLSAGGRLGTFAWTRDTHLRRSQPSICIRP